MNLQQMRDRLAAILAQLETFKGVENYSQEDVESINALSEEFETLQAQITAAEKIEAMTTKATESTRKVAPVAAAPRIEVKPSQKELGGGFNNFGDFLASVRKAAAGEVDRRFQNTMFEKNGEDGGFLVPETFLNDIQKKFGAEDSLLAKTRQFTVSGNNLTLPIDEQAPWNQGVQAYWVSEGAQIGESKPKLTGTASWKLHKLAALVKVTDELLEDAVALESYIRMAAPEAIVHKVNGAILSGNGVGKPEGILNSGFKVKVAKEAGQAADTVVAKNIIKMYSRMIPAARAKSAWYINPMVEEQLRMMKDDVGNYIYLAPGSQLNQTPYGMLMGLPVIPLLGSMPALGDEGDIILADLSAVYSVLKAGGMKQAVSQHLYFDRDIQCYKFTMRLDAKCPFKAPVVTEFGNYEMSSIVTLEAR